MTKKFHIIRDNHPTLPARTIAKYYSMQTAKRKCAMMNAARKFAGLKPHYFVVEAV